MTTTAIPARAAERLLEAVRRGDPKALENELAWAAVLCRESGGEHMEGLDLLAALVEDMRRVEAARAVHAELLKHLARAE